LYLGGEKLKLSLFALLVLSVGFLVQIPLISAQEEAAQGFGGGAAGEEAPLAAVDPLRAAEQAISIGDDVQTPAPASGSSTWAVIRMVLVLALAAAAVYGAVFFIKKSSRQTAADDPFLKILASSHLGSNRYAHIVSVGGKAWLLGSSDGGVNLIGEIDDKDVINAMLLEDSKRIAMPPTGGAPTGGTGPLLDFKAILGKLGFSAKNEESGPDQIRKRSERLKGL